MNVKHVKEKIAEFPLFPFLFALFPVLYLWSSNRAQQPAYVVVPSLVITFIGAALIYGLMLLILFRRPHRAALAATLVLLYLLSFGHLNNLFTRDEQTWPYLLPVSAGVVVLLLVIIAWRRAGSPALTKMLNLVALALVIFQVVPAGSYYGALALRNRTVEQRKSLGAEGTHAGVGAGMIPMTNVNGAMTGSSPERDVYFILLDNYGRQDVLLDKSDFDNTELVEALEERGFVFPQCAQSNYPHTAPMITTILNMEYLDTLGVPEKAYAKRGGYPQMAPFIQDSEVMRRFHEYGYHTVTFRGFMGLIDIQSSDTYINFEQDMGYERRLETANFQDLYFKTTAFHPINENLKIYPDWIVEKGPPFLRALAPSEEYLDPKYTKVYEQNLYAFDALERIPKEIEGPKFVYAHIYSAHWPHIIEADGSLRLPFTEKITKEGYVAGVQFTNARILEAIDSILANSETEPIIILQGDHSNGWEGKVEWSGKDRLKILSAYYLPDGGDQFLYDEISPANNFRLVFKHYFGENIDLLPDEWNYLDNATKRIKEAPKSCMNE